MTTPAPRRWDSAAEVPADLGATAVTLGVFDGVHRGHRLLIDRLVSRARERDLTAVAVTFDPHPSEVVRPGTTPPLLSTVTHRVDLLGEAGVDAVLVLPFTAGLSTLSPEEFVDTVLVTTLHARCVVVGQNFRFGHRAAGDVDTLADLGRSRGFDVEVVGLLTGGGGVWSSTYVRGLVAAGDVASAAASLGRPHRLEGVVVHGDHRGRELGYPTANLDVVPGTAIPADGVYAGRLIRHDGSALAAAISIGTNPTFDGVERRVEAYCLDAPPGLDLYGEAVALDVVDRLRPTLRFDSVEELVAQMADDVARTRRMVAAR